MSKNYDLGNAYELSYASRGGESLGACNWSLSRNGIPKFYKAKDGDDSPNKIVIVPYRIKSKLHPWVHSGKRKIGDLAYSLDIWVHRKVGPGEVAVICPAQSYGKACPLCEAASKWTPPKDDPRAQNPFKAKRRMYYNIIDMSDPEEGLKVFDVSHAYFEKELIGTASRRGENGQPIRFADPDNSIGKMIRFFGEKDKTYGTKFKDFEFLERKVDITGFIDKAVSFDELLTLHTYDEIMMIMTGTDEEESDADSEPGESSENVADERKPDTDDEDAALEARRKAKEAAKAEGANPCPSGYKFGIEWGDHPECKKDSCPAYKACGVAG